MAEKSSALPTISEGCRNERGGRTAAGENKRWSYSNEEFELTPSVWGEEWELGLWQAAPLRPV